MALSFGATLAASSGDASKGQRLFANTGCYECHGYAGQGALATGPRIARTELPLEAFTMALRSPASDMPPYETAILPDAAAADIYAYLQSLPVPPDPNSLPLPSPKGK
jgi:mono/diheme cytochrome c family protein